MAGVSPSCYSTLASGCTAMTGVEAIRAAFRVRRGARRRRALLIMAILR